MIDLYPGTLLYTAIYGAVEALVCTILGPAYGKLVDSQPRLSLMRYALLIENSTSVLTCVLFYIALNVEDPLPYYISIVVIAPIGEAASACSTLAVEKDWVVVLVSYFNSGDVTYQLSQLNSSMRRIDLLCKVLSPIAVGLVSNFWGVRTAVATVGIWNAVSFVLEVVLVSRVYHSVPTLADKDKVVLDALPLDPENESGHLLVKPSNSFSTYIKHPVLLCSVSFVLLFFNLMTNGSLVTTFLKWAGYSDLTLSIFRAISAALGMTSTLLVPTMISTFGLHKTALVFSWMFTLVLLPCILVFMVTETLQGNHAALLVFAGAISLSRLGLWGFDLSVTQITQQMVAPSIAGVINGYQDSLTRVMGLLAWALILYYSDPTAFSVPIYISYASIVVSSIVFTVFYMANSSSESQRIVT